MNDHTVAQPSRTAFEAISIVSHRLRTPLSVIKSIVEALLERDQGPLNPGQREYLNDAMTNVQRMARLIDSLIEVSRIEGGELELHQKVNDLAALAREVVDDLTILARASNIELRYVPPQSPLPSTAFDRVKIRATIYNIISNAIRYSRGKGCVSVSVRRMNDMLEFSCKDEGIGIAKGEKEKVFQKFFRSPRVIEMETDGSGLGLFIDKAVIEAHGGHLRFISEENKGSTFYFTLPIRNV